MNDIKLISTQKRQSDYDFISLCGIRELTGDRIHLETLVDGKLSREHKESVVKSLVSLANFVASFSGSDDVHQNRNKCVEKGTLLITLDEDSDNIHIMHADKLLASFNFMDSGMNTLMGYANEDENLVYMVEGNMTPKELADYVGTMVVGLITAYLHDTDIFNVLPPTERFEFTASLVERANEHTKEFLAELNALAKGGK